MGSVNLRFATFSVRNSNRVVTGDDRLSVDVRLADGPNVVDASSTELGNGSDTATAELSTTGIDNSNFLIGGATTGTLDLTLTNSSRVRARSRAETGSSSAKAGYPRNNTATNAFQPSDINGGVIQSRFSTGGNSYITSAIDFGASADAGSGGFPGGGSSALAEVNSGQGYGWYNSDLSANRTDATAAPGGFETLGGLLAAGVASSFDATATMAGTGDASAASFGSRQVGISSRPLVTTDGSKATVVGGNSLLFGFDGAEAESESVVVVDGAAEVTNAATATANAGLSDAFADIAGVAGILNDLDVSFNADVDPSVNAVGTSDFAITINATFGDVTGSGMLANNTATANSANGSSAAVAGSSFVGGVIDALQVVQGALPDPSFTVQGEFTIEFGLDGVVDGMAEADSEATAFTGDGLGEDATYAYAGNENVVGVSVASVQFDRDGEMITEAVNRENATATTTRSGAAAEAYAGSYDSSAVPVGSRTKGLLRTTVNTGRDLFTTSRSLTLRDPLLAKADARGSAVASSVSANATAEAAESAEVFGIDQSTITVGGDVRSAAGLGAGEGLLGVNAYQAYSARATATSAAGSPANAIATAGDDGAAVKGINASTLTAGDGHLAAFATNDFVAIAETTGMGDADATTDHEAVGIDDSTIDIGGGPGLADFDGFEFSGLQAQAQSTSVVVAGAADGNAGGISRSSAYGIRLDASSVDAVEVGLGDIRAFGYVGVAGIVDGSEDGDLDASYSAVGIKTASGDVIAVGEEGDIFAQANIYGIEAGLLAIGDPGELVAFGDKATTAVRLGEVSGIIGADTDSSFSSYTAGANGGNITGSAVVRLDPDAFGGASAKVNIGTDVAHNNSPADEVTGIRGANLNLGTSGLVPGGVVTGDASIFTDSQAAAGGTPTAPTIVQINRRLNAIGLRGNSSGGNRIVGASVINARAVNNSITDATAIYGPATVQDAGSAGGLVDYTTFTFGDGQLTTTVTLNAVSTASSFTFGTT